MRVGTRVRLIGDPGRAGVVGEGRRLRGTREFVRVAFPEREEFVPLDAIEEISAGPQTAIELFESGRLGTAADLRRGVTHVRLTGRLVDTIYSLHMTGTDFYAHQFKPIIKLLESTAGGILIADEVGLGKTIEAGLIWTELRARFDFRRMMVLCPAMLREKWRTELKTRFGVQPTIAKAGEALELLREAAAAPETTPFAIICSQQGLRPPEAYASDEAPASPTAQLAQFLEARAGEEPLIDLLVIDEAHYLRNPETQTAVLGRLLRRASNFTVLLSATPIHLRSDDLYHLLRLLDEDTFQSRDQFVEVLQANEPLVRARDLVLRGTADGGRIRELLGQARRNHLLSGSRQLKFLESEMPADSQFGDRTVISRLARSLDSANLLGHVLTRTRKRDVQEWRVVREARCEDVEMEPAEAAFYKAVTALVRRYCAKARGAEGFLLATPQRQMASSMAAALMSWNEGRVDDQGEAFEDLGDEADEAPGPLKATLVSQAATLGNFETLKACDSKYARLSGELTKYLHRNPTEKIVLFSYFRATLRYLQERLAADGIRSVVLQGGTDKEEVLAEFRRPDGPSILLSSEVGSEGIDLQFSRIVINYDLPWNPMKVEQRIGRIDRLGQQSPKISIWNFMYRDTIDERIYHRLHERLGLFEQSLGGLEPILGDRIQTLGMDLLRADLTPEQEAARIEQTTLAIENKQREEEELEENSSHLVAYGDYIIGQIHVARELGRYVVGEDLKRYAIDFLTSTYPGCEVRQPGSDPLDVEIALTVAAKTDLESFLRAAKLRFATRLVAHDRRFVACRFENTVVTTRIHDREILSQFHPLLRFASKTIEERVVRPHQAVAVRVRLPPGHPTFERGRYAFSVQRWTVQGVRDIERLWYAASRIDVAGLQLQAEEAERLVLAAANHGEE